MMHHIGGRRRNWSWKTDAVWSIAEGAGQTDETPVRDIVCRTIYPIRSIFIRLARWSERVRVCETCMCDPHAQDTLHAGSSGTDARARGGGVRRVTRVPRCVANRRSPSVRFTSQPHPAQKHHISVKSYIQIIVRVWSSDTPPPQLSAIAESVMGAGKAGRFATCSSLVRVVELQVSFSCFLDAILSLQHAGHSGKGSGSRGKGSKHCGA